MKQERIAGPNARRILAQCTGPNGTYWQDRHHSAVVVPRGIERPFRDMITAWISYATEFEKSTGSRVSGCGYTREYWLDIGRSLRALLATDVGRRLDCGTVDGFILRAIKDQGFDLTEEGF